jgi:glycosyltransferase involved in cell wall biosynthesis
MNFVVITHVLHKSKGKDISAYAPYVREMNLWLKYVDKITVVAPVIEGEPNAIEMPYQHQKIKLKKIPEIQFTSLKHILKSIVLLPSICIHIFKVCKTANHIHLRCPGNIGLLGCLIQIFFPKKIKTAKYAGNWDPKAKQLLSYKFQKWILSNTFLTKNIQVLVYGKWMNQTKNIKEFFTATYHNSEKEEFVEKDYSGVLNFVFAGSLVQGKRPFFAIEIVGALHKKGIEVRLDIFGEGVLKGELLDYIQTNQLDSLVKIHGNQSKEGIKNALKKAHFSILPSKSEGWPKAIAEGMFFGAIPVATPVSCVPFMLDYGKRGILIDPKLNAAVAKIEDALNHKDLKMMSKFATDWSQTFTLEYFESEIKKLLTH